VTDSPSLLLQRAAELIEKAESRAVIGPWSTCGPNVTGGGDEQGDVATATTSTTALWIATMSPSVAAPLVAWLREAASAFESYGGMPAGLMQSDETAGAYGHTYRFMNGALGFARLILGGTAEGKERSDP
jgi:hypothetical protein